VGAVHDVVGDEKRELKEVHFDVTVQAKGTDHEWEERCDVIRRAHSSVGKFEHTGFDGKVSCESASFELQKIPAIRCASLWENDDGWILSCLFNYLLSICDLFNYLVSFFFCSSSCDENAAQTFTQEPDDRNFLEVMFGCESWSVVSDH